MQDPNLIGQLNFASTASFRNAVVVVVVVVVVVSVLLDQRPRGGRERSSCSRVCDLRRNGRFCIVHRARLGEPKEHRGLCAA
jgi:hypothetical protein